MAASRVGLIASGSQGAGAQQFDFAIPTGVVPQEGDMIVVLFGGTNGGGTPSLSESPDKNVTWTISEDLADAGRDLREIIAYGFVGSGTWSVGDIVRLNWTSNIGSTRWRVILLRGTASSHTSSEIAGGTDTSPTSPSVTIPTNGIGVGGLIMDQTTNPTSITSGWTLEGNSGGATRRQFEFTKTSAVTEALSMTSGSVDWHIGVVTFGPAVTDHTATDGTPITAVWSVQAPKVLVTVGVVDSAGSDTAYSFVANKLRAGRFESPHSGFLRKITARMSSLAAGRNARAVMYYARPDGGPGVRVEENGSNIALPSSGGFWQDFTFSGVVAPASGLVWLGVILDGNLINIDGFNNLGVSDDWDDTFTGGPDDPAAQTGTGFDTVRSVIYATIELRDLHKAMPLVASAAWSVQAPQLNVGAPAGPATAAWSVPDAIFHAVRLVDAVSAAWSVPDATTVGVQTPDAITVVWSVPEATTGEEVSTPDPVTAAWSVQEPVYNVTQVPDPVASAWSVPDANYSADVLAPVASSVWSVQDPVYNVVQVPDALGAVWSVPEAQGSAGLQPIQVTYSVPDTQVNATWPAGPATAAWSALDAIGVHVITPGTITSAWSVPAAAQLLTLSAAPVTAVYSVQDPILGLGLVADPVVAVWSVPSTTQDAVFTPSPITATWVVPDPIVEFPIAPAIATWSVPAPDIAVDGLSPVVAHWVVPAVTWNLEVAPAPLSLNWSVPAADAPVPEWRIGVKPLTLNWIARPPSLIVDRFRAASPVTLIYEVVNPESVFSEQTPVCMMTLTVVSPDQVGSVWGECDPDVESSWVCPDD